MFSNQYLTGSLLITACVTFHVLALMLLSKILKTTAQTSYLDSGRFSMVKKLLLLIMAVLLTIFIHTIEIIIWALTYIKLGEFEDFSQAVYFSTVTATTLGYGDLTLSEPYQLLSGFEAVGGLILFGLTTAFFIKLVAIFFQGEGIKDHD